MISCRFLGSVHALHRGGGNRRGGSGWVGRRSPAASATGWTIAVAERRARICYLRHHAWPRHGLRPPSFKDCSFGLAVGGWRRACPSLAGGEAPTKLLPGLLLPVHVPSRIHATESVPVGADDAADPLASKPSALSWTCRRRPGQATSATATAGTGRPQHDSCQGVTTQRRRQAATRTPTHAPARGVDEGASTDDADSSTSRS
jgi:hypothetical protein